MTSSIQSIEEGPDVDFGPAIVVALNDTNTLSERQSRGDEKRATHLEASVSDERVREKIGAEAVGARTARLPAT